MKQRIWVALAALAPLIFGPAAFAVESPIDPNSVSAIAYGIEYHPNAGEPLYNDRCAACHDHPSGRTPAKSVIANNTPASIFGTLNDGLMRANATGISYADKLAIAMFVSQNKSGGAAAKTSFETPTCAQKARLASLTGWNAWGDGVQNLRYQPTPGLSAAEVPRLKLKWAMAAAGNRSGQPVIAGPLLFTNDTAGAIYALNAKTGCAYWRYNADGATRSTISLAPLPANSKRMAAFFTDAAGYLYALDAEHGTLIWRTKVDAQRSDQFTGSVTVYAGVVYVPVASGEEAYAMDDAYPCCKFRGALVAVNVDSGTILWTTYTTQTEPQAFKKNRAGNWMYGPGGGAVWSAPTIDAQRQLVYIATGDSYTDVPHEGSDAVIAMHLNSGKIAWLKQLTQHDSYIIGCERPSDKQPANCPTAVGPDDDFGASVTLTSRADGKQIILASQKSGQVYALDPDAAGRIIWEKRLSPGGPLGGSEWGHAVDLKNIYVGISDLYVAEAKPQLTALSIADGVQVWSQTLTKRPCRWTNVYCSPGISMAVTAIPEAVFAGSLDGWITAYASEDGKVLWSFNTGDTFTTTMGVQADGGTLDAAGPVLAGGMLYVHSGYWGRSGPGSVLLAFSIDGK